MVSKWFNSKEKALKMRKRGVSLREIEENLGIPRSTLSGWLRNVRLTQKQKLKLKNNWLEGLRNARIHAVAWHNQQKEIRLKEAEEHALRSLSKIDITNESILELALAMLYLGEGSKSGHTALGSSNPEILNFFITGLLQVYKFNLDKIKCELHLRADQNPDEIRKYWSEKLGIPIKNFTNISVDKRTIGRATYPSYKGVCILQCGNIALQRRLVYLSQKFCEEIANLRAVSSAGRASA